MKREAEIYGLAALGVLLGLGLAWWLLPPALQALYQKLRQILSINTAGGKISLLPIKTGLAGSPSWVVNSDNNTPLGGSTSTQASGSSDSTSDNSTSPGLSVTGTVGNLHGADVDVDADGNVVSQ